MGGEGLFASAAAELERRAAEQRIRAHIAGLDLDALARLLVKVRAGISTLEARGGLS